MRERPEGEKHRTEVTEATEEELVRGFELTKFRRPDSIFLAKYGQPRDNCGWAMEFAFSSTKRQTASAWG